MRLFFIVMSLQFQRVVTVTAQYARSPDDLFASGSDLGNLLAVMSNIAVYRGLPNAQIVRWMAFVTDLTFGGWLKIKGHHVHLDSLYSVERCLQCREYGAIEGYFWPHSSSKIARAFSASASSVA